MTGNIAPRADRIVLPGGPADLRPPEDIETVMEHLPSSIRDAAGAIEKIEPLAASRSNLVLHVLADEGHFVLKVAEGAYRIGELWAEYTCLTDLEGGLVPVPRAESFGRTENLAYLLREYVPGVPLSDVLGGPEGTAAFTQMTRVLGQIHMHLIPGPSGEEWLESSLRAAEHNMHAGVLDPNEFREGETPETMLERLRATRPVPERPCLIHGDFRAKNLIWSAGRIVAVLDWGFADVGDPYYDYAIATEYGGPETGFRFLDADRLRWMHNLSKFINI
jgi:aminoglycoside phosphotransferase (APT) family kinase protein